jgi:hypothetical protein
MTTTSKFKAGVLTYEDMATNETILPLASIFFEDDFVGAFGNAFPTAATAGSLWGKKLVQTAGVPAVGLIANGPAGQAKILLDATSEDQEAVLYFLDNLAFDTSKVGGFEVRLQTPVIPTGNVQAALGLASVYNAGPDTNAAYVRYGLRGNGAILAESFDGTTRNSKAVGVTIATTTEWHTLRMDWPGIGAANVWVDGVNTASLALPFVPSGGLAVMQPYLSLFKASGTGIGTLAIDYFRTWANRV